MISAFRQLKPPDVDKAPADGFPLPLTQVSNGFPKSTRKTILALLREPDFSLSSIITSCH